jgi:hypothetical protein
MTQDTIQPDSINPAAAQAGEYYEDYWGVQETFRFELKDGKQYFEIVPMDEGAKTRFQKLTNKGIRMNQRTQDATIDVDPSDERHTLITESVVAWNIMQKGADGQWSPLPCPEDDQRRKRVIRDTILAKFNPKVIQDLEFFIRTKNPWMQADQELSDLLEQRDQLDELIKQAKEREAGEGSSANK